MAIKPTIYKLIISLSDLNRDYYDQLNLTVAQHPSENLERMMARVIAYCIEAQPGLEFTQGLFDVDQPDIWRRTLDDQIACWIDMGEPSIDRIKKATRMAQEVKVYTFNSKSNIWWQENRAKLEQVPVSIIQLDWEQVHALVKSVQRSMNFSMTITGESAFIASHDVQYEVDWTSLVA